MWCKWDFNYVTLWQLQLHHFVAVCKLVCLLEDPPCVLGVCVSITPMGLLLCQCSAIISLYLPSIHLHLCVSPATISHLTFLPLLLSLTPNPPTSHNHTHTRALTDRVDVCVNRFTLCPF